MTYCKDWSIGYDPFLGRIEVLEPIKIKGKEHTMKTISLDIKCNEVTYQTEGMQVFYLDEPKFKIGDKVKVRDSVWDYYGVITAVESNVRIHKNEKSPKFQRDQNTWSYTVKSQGGQTHDGMKETSLSEDTRKKYDDYFNFLDKQGVRLDRDRYTWKSFLQKEFTYFPNYVFASGVYNQRDIRYEAVLCDKNTGKDIKFEGKQTGTELLSAISEKC